MVKPVEEIVLLIVVLIETRQVHFVSTVVLGIWIMSR